MSAGLIFYERRKDMQVKIGKMAKRTNSTKRSFTGDMYNIVLKDSISMKNPKLLITGHPDTKCNYMSYQDAYYWIEDIVSNTDGTSWVVGSLDNLATFKPSIQNSHGLVRFGPASAKSDQMDDTRFGPDIPWIGARDSVVIPDVDVFSKQGTCMHTTISCRDGGTVNGVNTYMMSFSVLKQVLNRFGELIGDFRDLSDVFEVLANLVVLATGGGNWSDNIKSLVWVPFSPSTVISKCPGVFTTTTNVTIGGFNVSLPSSIYVADTAPVAIYHTAGTVDIPWAADADTYKFLRRTKYTSMTLCHPCGAVEIDSNCLVDQSTMYYHVAIDFISGQYYCRIQESSQDSAEPLAMVQGNVAMDIMGMVAGGKGGVLGQVLSSAAGIAAKAAGIGIQTQPAKVATTDTQTKTDLASGTTQQKSEQKVETSYRSTDTGISKTFENCAVPPSSCGGQLGQSPLTLYQTNSFASQFFIQMNAMKPRIMIDISDYEAYCAKYGWPINSYMSLSGISGYVECGDVSIEPAGTYLPNAHELSELNSQLCSGLYIE